MYSGWAQAMTGDAPGGIERLSDGVAVHVNIGQRLGPNLPWTTDWYRDSHGDPHSSDVDALCCVPTNPSGPDVEASFDPNQPKLRVAAPCRSRRSWGAAPFRCGDDRVRCGKVAPCLRAFRTSS